MLQMAPAAQQSRPDVPKPKQTYMPGLDVLRGVAICMVLLLHGLARNNGAVFRHYHSAAWSALEFLVGTGVYGVHLFFVLSGLLITGILLDTKDNTDYYKQFFVRRVLRILPAYLLMIAVLVLCHWITWKYVLVCLLYLCNMPGLLGTGPQYGPLWSLSVEEQFYLLWPFTVRRLSTRGLTLLLLAILLFDPVLRFSLLQLHGSVADFSKKTWGVADFFAAGALISVARRSPRARASFGRVGLLLLVAGPVLLALSESWHPKGPHLAQLQAATTFDPWLILFSGLVLLALHWPSVAHHPVARPLLFFSRISYGLYLCHQLIFTLVEKYWPSHPTPGTERFPLVLGQFLVGVVLSAAIATLSRETLEAYFLQLKPRPHAARAA